MPAQIVGKVLSIALRTGKRMPMREVESVRAQIDGGLEGDVEAAARRGVTFISRDQWRDTMRDLDAELPWHTRRANVLVDAPKLGPLIGRTICIGEVEVEITGETKPCELMDQLHNGLRAALVPDCRGGVHGRIRRGGSIHVGDSMVLAG